MRLCIISLTNTLSTETRLIVNLVPLLKGYGIDVAVNDCDHRTDIVLANSSKLAGPILEVQTELPTLPVVCYNWDLYPWTKDRFDFTTYGEVLRRAQAIWCPSQDVVLRTQEMFGLGHRCEVMHSYAEFFEAPVEPSDAGFVYHPLRPYEDPQYGWSERAAAELGIEFRRGNHGLSLDEYQQTVMSCSFLVTEYVEASTGGLTLLEGFFHGKRALVCNSPYMGARDYLGDAATYFRQGDYEDFKAKFAALHRERAPVDIVANRLRMRPFHIDVFAHKVARGLHEVLRARR